MQSHSGLSDKAPQDARPHQDAAPGTRLPIDIRRFPWIRRLAADYIFDHARVAEFFAGDPADPSAWRDTIARTQRHARQRDRLVPLLHAQQHARAAHPSAIDAASDLADPKSVAIVTGQQAGLFGGPLFTLLKALTAVHLAERVRAEHHVPAVPVFWIDAEDHDWNEVKACRVLDSDLKVLSIDAGDPPGSHDSPIARVRLDDSVGAALDALERALPPTEFTPALLDGLRAAYCPGTGMADAFGRWLEQVLGPRGLVVFDASDRAAKPLVAQLFAQEVEHAGRTAKLAAEAGQALTSRDYHVQVSPQEGSVALFHLNGGRLPIKPHADGFQVGEEVVPAAALLKRVIETPDAFSPNVLLRPLVQDTLFPTACYVAGPNELAYLGQLRHVYEAFSLPMPLIQPRASATILDTNSMRFLGRYDIPVESLRAQDEAVLNEVLEAQLPPSVETSMEEAVNAVQQRLDRVAREVLLIDPTLEGAARSTLSRMQDDLKKLNGKIIQAAKRKDETLRRQFRHAKEQAFPGGEPQERVVGFVYFLNKYGPALVDRLSRDLPFDAGTHWVVTI
ncbi:MAG TPA: bacillithiol biosynthesis cysteine-adding enzyme BshC [Vicinamibacterales bacterium]